MNQGQTVRQLWEWLAGGPVTDSLLDWAPDIGALTGVAIERSHAFRFVVSPPEAEDWPPPEHQPFDDVVIDAAAAWRDLMDAGAGGAPELVRSLWADVQAHLDTPIATLALGEPWPLCRAVLMLHAIADEAAIGRSAGSMRTGARGDPPGAGARAAGAHRVVGPAARPTGSRICPRSVPRPSASPTGRCPGTAARRPIRSRSTWHRAPLRKPGADPTARHANILLLPWPLRIRETDFVPVPGSIHRPEREPFGFFSYEPSEPVDLDLLDRLLETAQDEVDRVDVVIMPEGRLAESEIEAFEEVLARRHVRILVTGHPPRAPRARPVPRQRAAHRRAGGQAVVALPAEQAPPVVPGRQPDRDLQHRRGAASQRQVVGGDGHPAARRSASSSSAAASRSRRWSARTWRARTGWRSCCGRSARRW